MRGPDSENKVKTLDYKRLEQNWYMKYIKQSEWIYKKSIFKVSLVSYFVFFNISCLFSIVFKKIELKKSKLRSLHRIRKLFIGSREFKFGT